MGGTRNYIHEMMMKKFEKGEVLTARRLNELIEEVGSMGDVVPARVVPPALPTGQGKPGNAWFNDPAALGDDGAASYWDECEGMVYQRGDYAGLLAAARWAADARELRISDGVLVLTMAQYEGGEQATCGGVWGIVYNDALEQPRISNGLVELPRANGVPHADTAAGVYGTVLSVGAEVDGVGWCVRDGHIHVGLADMCSGVAGVLSEVRIGKTLSLSRGVLTIPDGGGFSDVAGVVDASGQQVSWSDMVDAPVRLTSIFDYENNAFLYLTGQMVDGFLKFNTELR